MDDMDKEAIELGGSAKFFSGDYEKYAWDKLFDTKVTAAEMLRLYSDAIESMEKNPNIPKLFRDIFNNAYLPYRDPETLKLFLKTIGEFEYTHSEKLGDAFEYLLSVMGSQGDAGQFRTPRHIIDFLVAIIDPDKGETILDPACGTAGFLISAYKHILLKHTKANKEGLNIYEYNKLEKKPFNNLGDALTPDERKKLIQNFAGYDISPDMVRLSLVNLYLHGFSDPHINEYDTLSSEDRWNENFDVVLANPPFMSPKGGIRPHKKFTISSNRSEVLFVDYIAEHLNPKGKAGIIVPEGVIFQSGTAYKDLRKMLVENYLYAVVSLPAGVFNPYSGVKTSILLMDKAIAKQRNEILFVKIDNDGYNLGAQRAAVKGSQLEEAIDVLNQFKERKEIQSTIANSVLKSEIGANGEFNLSGSRYITNDVLETEFDKVALEEVLDYEQPTNYIVENEEYDDSFKIPVLTAGKTFILGYTNEESGIFNNPLPVIIFDDFTTATKFVDFPFKVKSSAMKILKAKENANITFLYYLMQHIQFDSSDHKRYWISQYSKIQIPLPPLSIQAEIVAEIEGYQKIIDGAKAVVANYKPKIDIDPNWEMVELGEIIDELETGVSVNSESRNIKKGEKGVLKTSAVTYGIFLPEEHKTILPAEYERAKCNPKKDSIIISRMNTENLVGASAYVKEDFHDLFLPDRLWQTVISRKDISARFVHLIISSEDYRKRISEICGGTSGSMKNISKKNFLSISIPLPDLETQGKIVAQIENEQALVNANIQLIQIFEQKIKDRIAKVWGVEKTEEETLNMAAEPKVEYEKA